MVEIEAQEASCDHEVEAKDEPRSEYSEATVEKAAALLRAAGDPARLRLLESLIDREVCVSELAASSGELMSTISQRLRLLRVEGLVNRRRDGRHMYYSLTDHHVVDLVKTVLAHAGEDG